MRDLLLNRVIYTLPGSLNKVIYKFIRLYYRKTRSIRFRDLDLDLLPTVFHPTFYLTTEILLDYLLTIDLTNKTILELGCGSAAISLYLSKHRDGYIHASDINPKAIEGVRINKQKLNLNVSVYHSDLFDNIPQITFDIIILNPPFFDNPINTDDEFAFNAGEDFNYFKRVSSQLLERRNSIGIVYMILTDRCNKTTILSHFNPEIFRLSIEHKVQILGETHFIYSLT